MNRAPADAGALGWTPRRRLVESATERETVLESLGADAGGRGRILPVEGHGLEGRDAERLPIRAHLDWGGAALLRGLALSPGGDELITLPGDAHRLERPDTRVGVVEARPQHGLGLAASHLPLCLAVVTARGDEGDDESDDDRNGGDDEHPRAAGVLLRLAVLRLVLHLGGRRAGRLVDGAGHFGPPYLSSCLGTIGTLALYATNITKSILFDNLF